MYMQMYAQIFIYLIGPLIEPERNARFDLILSFSFKLSLGYPSSQ